MTDLDVADDLEIVQDHPVRRPGSTCRPGRVRVHKAQLSDRLARRSPKLSECEHQVEVDRLAAEQTNTPPALQRELDKLKPTSTSPARINIVPEIEVAAANRLPVMVWLYDQLHSCMPGRNADRRFAVAVLVFMTTLSRSVGFALRQLCLQKRTVDDPDLPDVRVQRLAVGAAPLGQLADQLHVGLDGEVSRVAKADRLDVVVRA